MRTINVCIGSACHLKGSYDVIQIFQQKIKENKLEDQIELKAAFCLGECTNAVSVKLDDGKVLSVSPGEAANIFEKYILRGE